MKFRHLLAFSLALPLTTSAQDYKYPDSFVIEDVPPVPQELRQNAARYLEFRSAGFNSWHPVKREMLITTRFAETAQLHRVSMPGGARTQLTFLPEPVGGGSYRPKKGDIIVFG